MAGPVDFDGFHRGGSRPEVLFWRGSRCRLRDLSMDFDCPRLAQLISAIFKDGGSAPEVVFRSDFPCYRRDFSIDPDCPRLVQSVLVV